MKVPFLVETTRLELVTPCMSSKYSDQLSYASKAVFIIHELIYFVNTFYACKT